MIYAGFSDILYPGGTLGENSCITCAFLPLLYTSAVTLHSTQRTFTFIMLIDNSPPSAAIYASTRIPVAIQCCWACQSLFCTSHRVVVSAERDRVFFTFTITVISVNVIIVILLLSPCTSTVLSASQCRRFRKIARFKNSFMSRYESSGIVISVSSLIK